MKAKCLFCNKEEEQLIKKYKFWKVLLNINQYYLGRIIVALNKHKEDFLDTEKEEREELFEIMNKIAKALKKLFNPDLLNYAILMNQEKHLHLHIIPRYKEEKIFDNVIFRDENFGHNPFSNNEFEIPIEIFNKIKEKIKTQLEK